MAIGDVLRVGSEIDEPDWARYHPHFTDLRALNNTVYIAADHVFEQLPGAGAFEVYRPELCLTDLSQHHVRAESVVFA